MYFYKQVKNILKIALFTVGSRNVKCLAMIPTKLYRVSTQEDYKKILKVIKEDLNKWLWIGKLCIVKITILPKLVYRFYAKAIKNMSVCKLSS